jgi:hypothetical protein
MALAGILKLAASIAAIFFSAVFDTSRTCFISTLSAEAHSKLLIFCYSDGAKGIVFSCASVLFRDRPERRRSYYLSADFRLNAVLDN